MRLLNEEREFGLHELFFSTTDTRGVIRHGNEVFARVAGFSLDELIGSPHSIIRHPDMPRAVFRLLWDAIGKGDTIAAYVKNLAADGRYYWVLAVAMPIENGYLSVRMKPSSKLLPVVQQAYDCMLTLERKIECEPKRRSAAMEASTELLHRKLCELGFPTYEDFMRHALATELRDRKSKLLTAVSGFRNDHCSRDESSLSNEFAFLLPFQVACHALDVELNTVFDQLEEFKAMNIRLAVNSKKILQSADSIRSLSMNATIAANKMGNRAATMLTVAESLGEVSNDSQLVINELASRMQTVIALLNRLMFDVAVTKLQCEIAILFLDELLSGTLGVMNVRLEGSLKTLFQQIFSRIDSVFGHVMRTEGRMLELRTQIERLERNNRTLSFVQFAGKKESNGEANEFGLVFHEVRSHIDATKRDCDCLFDAIQGSLNQLRSLHIQKRNLSDSLAVLGNLDHIISENRDRSEEKKSFE